MTKTGYASFLAAALAALVLCTLAGTPRVAEAAFPGGNGGIFFETARDDGRTNIYSINPDGTGARSLPRSSEAVADTNPAVSADGSKVAYEHDRDIWIMDADGSNPRPVTTDGARREDLQPAFSPDGARIAFYGITSTSREIYTINTDGTGLTPLTDSPAQEEQPAWSPDGARIAYVVCCHDIWVMDAGGANKTNLTGSSTFPGVRNDSLEPNFSPDGSKIAFTAGPHCDFSCSGTDIYVMDAGGGGETNLTPNDERHFQPVFSPDGTEISFTSNTINGTQHDIFTMNADGTGRTSLTDDAAMDANPDWAVPPSDRDGDGVPDYGDACPDRPANTANGCPPPDTTKPTVKSTVPANGATGVGPGANVTATFSEPMRANTINVRTVGLRRAGTTTNVPATVRYDPATRKATLDPKARLRAGTRYVATVTAGAKDMAGNPLAANKTWKFTTRRGGVAATMLLGGESGTMGLILAGLSGVVILGGIGAGVLMWRRIRGNAGRGESGSLRSR